MSARHRTCVARSNCQSLLREVTVQALLAQTRSKTHGAFPSLSPHFVFCRREDTVAKFKKWGKIQLKLGYFPFSVGNSDRSLCGEKVEHPYENRI